MKSASSIDQYIKYYADLNFERAGLFELIKEKYDCRTILYPGCSIHIIPSFYFQHVVYVDISKNAKEFFANTQDILSYVNSNKKYKQLSYIQFIHDDFTRPLPLRENNYDLLIALFAGGITLSCKKHVKSGGIILTNNHHSDALEALKDSSFSLDALITKKGKRYEVNNRIKEEDLPKILKNVKQKKDVRNTDRGIEYMDNEVYIVFKKVK